MLTMFISLVRDALFFLGYLSERTAFPRPLTAKEERAYLARMQAGDDEARRALIEHNLRLVAHIARKYTVPGCDADDLVSIGAIGLIKAVGTFRPESGATLSTYASRCIENEILMCLRAAQKRRNDVSLDEPVGADAEGNEVTLMEMLGTDPDAVCDEVDRRITLSRIRRLIREKLPERERTVLEMRYGLLDGCARPQHEVARRLGISRSYVSRRAYCKRRRKEAAAQEESCGCGKAAGTCSFVGRAEQQSANSIHPDVSAAQKCAEKYGPQDGSNSRCAPKAKQGYGHAPCSMPVRKACCAAPKTPPNSFARSGAGIPRRPFCTSYTT